MDNPHDDRLDPADLAALGLTEAEFMRDLAIAEETARRLEIHEPRAKAVTYLPSRQSLCFDLQDGSAVIIPLARLPLEIPAGTDLVAAFSRPEIDGDGEYVRWAALEDGLTVPGTILQTLYGQKVWRAWSENWGAEYQAVRAQVMAEYGQKGGRTITPAKSAAARANGRKGGRPRKLPPAAGE